GATGKAVGLGVCGGVEGPLLAGAGPEAAARYLMAVGLLLDPVGAVRDANTVLRCGPPGEPGRAQVGSAPKEVHRAGLTDEARPKLQHYPVGLHERQPEPVSGVPVV